MKKIYESPRIVFEDMSLNSVIAVCDLMELPNNTLLPNGSTVEDGWFFFNHELCTAGDPGDEDDPFCYHSPDNEDAWRVVSFS